VVYYMIYVVGDFVDLWDVWCGKDCCERLCCKSSLCIKLLRISEEYTL
jgi:hypothetical protein